MTQEQWDRAFSLFHEALDTPHAERTAFLESACRDNEIRAEVRSLLANSGDADPFLSQPALEGVRDAIDAALDAPDSGRQQLIADLIGTTIAARYRIVGCIGKGGYAVVLLALDERVGNRKVVLKVLDGETLRHAANRDWIERKFREEMESLARINHPGVVGISDCGRLANGQPFLVMNFVEGVNLRERMRTPIGREEAAEIIRQMGSALSAAHAAGVVHLDLKPENVMLSRAGEDRPASVRLIDFGLARIENSNPATAPVDGMVAGTTSYMAPEQFRGIASPASDIYAMGVICFELLTGSRPQILGPGHELPGGVRPLLTPAFAQEPEKRPANAEVFGDSLSRTLLGHAPRRRFAIVAAVAAVVVMTGAAYFWQRDHTPPLTDKDVLVLADLNNTTGEPVFDVTLREALSAGLEESPFLKILDDSQMRAELKLMGKDPLGPIPENIAREVCVRQGLKATVGGSINRLGQHYALSLRVVNCQSGSDLAREETEAEDREHVLRALAAAEKGLRERLGESLNSISKSDRPLLYPVTTPSLEAFRAYALGMAQVAKDNDPGKTVPLFQRAVDLDPQFPMGWQLLASMYLNRGDEARAKEGFEKAYSLRMQASEREQLEITAYYQANVRLDLDKAAETLTVYQQSYPRLSFAPMSLGSIEAQRGNFEGAAEDFRQAIYLDPKVVFYKSNLAMAYIAAGRSNEARTILQGLTNDGDPSINRALLLYIARVTGDRATDAREMEWFEHRPDDPWAWFVGYTDYVNGQIRHAQAFLGNPVRAASKAELFATVGDCNPARFNAVASLGPRQFPDDAFSAGLALAGCGGGNVEKLAEEMTQRYPSATLWNGFFLPSLRAAQAVRSGQPAKAIDLLRVSTPFERAWPQATYVRGLAYLGLGNGPEAAAEFQKILDKRGTFLMQEVYSSVALVGLARAAALSRDTAKAKKTYENFFNLWKDADPDVPLLVAARKEYSLLR